LERSTLLHHASLLQQMARILEGQQFITRPGQSGIVNAETLEQTASFLWELAR